MRVMIDRADLLDFGVEPRVDGSVRLHTAPAEHPHGE
jgi:hypothetical protein